MLELTFIITAIVSQLAGVWQQFYGDIGIACDLWNLTIVCLWLSRLEASRKHRIEQDTQNAQRALAAREGK